MLTREDDTKATANAQVRMLYQCSLALPTCPNHLNAITQTIPAHYL
jgi:hypothetical protein